MCCVLSIYRLQTNVFRKREYLGPGWAWRTKVHSKQNVLGEACEKKHQQRCVSVMICSYLLLLVLFVLCFSYPTDASYPVNGNTAICIKQYEKGLNSPYKTVLWKIDLGGVHNIKSISILFKTYMGTVCCLSVPLKVIGITIRKLIVYELHV